MRGHIRKRGRNSWAVVVPLPRDPETGKPRQKWVTVRGTKKDAEAVLAKLLAEAHAGGLGTAPARLTLGECLERWLEAVEKELKPHTRAAYRTAIRVWRQKSGLWGLPLSKLTALDIQKALATLQKSHTSMSCRMFFTVLRAALRQAVKWELIPKNPAEGVKPPPVRRQDELRTWTEEEAARFLEAARKSKHYALFVLALSTGMRLGELLGLKWEDVNLEAGVVEVKRTLVRMEATGGKVVFAAPKSAASRRRIPLDGFTLEVLRKHKKKQARIRLRQGNQWQDHGLVFCTRTGLPLYQATVRNAFYRFVRKAKVKPIRFHDLRHTHATFLLRQGVHPKVVAERLGHSSAKVTLDTYSHVLPDTQQEAVRAIERLFRTKGPNAGR